MNLDGVAAEDMTAPIEGDEPEKEPPERKPEPPIGAGTVQAQPDP